EKSLPGGEGRRAKRAGVGRPSSLREEPPSPRGGRATPAWALRRIVLRRLAPLEHTVIADDADCPMPQRARCRRLPALRCRRIAPGREQDDLAGGVDAGEDLLVDQPGGPVTKLEP